MLPTERPFTNRLNELRRRRGESQNQLARRAGISRAAISAIEIHRLATSVTAAQALARAFDCSVESFFGFDPASTECASWTWAPTPDPCRFWQARVGGPNLRFPLKDTVAGMLPP
jgi:DNA-binding XRE family transcriptional regulator